MSLGWSGAFTIAARLPNKVPPVLLDVLVLELRIRTDGDGGRPDGVACRREGVRLVWVPLTESRQAANDEYVLCGKRQDEVRVCVCEIRTYPRILFGHALRNSPPTPKV